MKRIKYLACGTCLNDQRLRLDMDTMDPTGIECDTCGPTTWLNLPNVNWQQVFRAHANDTHHPANCFEDYELMERKPGRHEVINPTEEPNG